MLHRTQTLLNHRLRWLLVAGVDDGIEPWVLRIELQLRLLQDSVPDRHFLATYLILNTPRVLLRGGEPRVDRDADLLGAAGGSRRAGGAAGQDAHDDRVAGG